MKGLKHLILILLSLLLSSCIPAIIGAVAYKSSKTKEAKQQFMANFHQTNLEREKHGLPLLDLCTEQYYFDKGWADDDPNCAKRIADYEAGITEAIGTRKCPCQKKVNPIPCQKKVNPIPCQKKVNPIPKVR